MPPQQGDTLVTSIDARLQRLAEKSLLQQIHDSRKAGEPATSGAVVAMDPQTGRILAAASYPTYDPQQFIGGISNADYAKLTRAVGEHAAARPRHRRSVRARVDIQADHLVVTGDAPRDQHAHALPVPGLGVASTGG